MAQQQKQTVAPTCWFLQDPFQQLMVYQQLVKMNYDYVVGMDIGHGESMVYLYRKTEDNSSGKAKKEDFRIDRLRLNYDNDPKIPTMIRFDADRVIIGKRAKDIPGFVQDFKVRPAQWSDSSPHRDLLKAFIGTLWQQILEYNPDLGLKQASDDGKLLITVGCPSSPDWTGVKAMEKYQELIQSATGCPHVAVLAESTAAIMSAILDVNESKIKVDLSRGVAVVDAGSSTIDFTYVLLGRKLITRSLDVAGYRLDEAIMEEALEKSGLTMAQIPAQQKESILVRIREIKEAFYPDQHSLGTQSIDLWGYNADGVADRDIFSGLQLKFVMNRAFMDEVLNRRLIQRGVYDLPLTWVKHCEKFISDCSVPIPRDEKGNMLCDKVILTGGTSFVPALRQAVQTVFPGKDVPSMNPSDSVARGLCFAKGLEIKGNTQVEEYQKEMQWLADKGYQNLLWDLSKHLTRLVCDDIRDVVVPYAVDSARITAGQLLDEVNKKVRVNSDLAGAGCKQKVQDLFTEHFLQIQTPICHAANTVSKKIYGANLKNIPTIPQLTAADLARITKKLDISAMTNGTWLNTVVSGINFSAISGLLFILGWLTMEFPALGLSLWGLSVATTIPGIQRMIAKFVAKKKAIVPQWLLQEMAIATSDGKDRKKLEEKATLKTYKTLKKQKLLNTEFTDCATAQAEAVLGKMLFLVFDEQPDMQ